MPHIEIKCYPGRTDAQKQQLADKIALDVAELFDTKLSSVSIAIKDVSPEDWKAQVWDANIVPDEEHLFKKPGYRCE